MGGNYRLAECIVWRKVEDETLADRTLERKRWNSTETFLTETHTTFCT